MKYLKVFTDFRELIEPLDDSERGRLFTAMLDYAETGTAPALSGNERFVFPRAKQIIDLENAFCDKQAANGAKGGRPKKTQANPQKPNETQENPLKAKKASKEKEKEKENTLNPIGLKSIGHPTVEEVASYCKERNNSVDAQRFVDYYSSQKWRKANGQPLSDWRAAVRTWEGRETRKDKYRSEGYEQHPITTAQLRDAFVDLSAYD